MFHALNSSYLKVLQTFSVRIHNVTCIIIKLVIVILLKETKRAFDALTWC